MPDLHVKTLTGSDTHLKTETIDKLRESIRGKVLTAESEQYNEARTIWNAMIDKRPALIVRCASAADVMRAVRFAGEHKLLVAVRGGGHNIAGNAVCDGGLMIDLSPMKSVRVDAKGMTARVEPGVTLGEFDRDTQAFGLATPVGINSTTGIAGLTLGGGFGWLSRKLGLSIDNLISADVVTAAGDLVTASETDHPDLFWGIRGGGGNFGVVTSFEFRLHKVGPEVFAGLISPSSRRGTRCSSVLPRFYQNNASRVRRAGSCCAWRRLFRSSLRSGTGRKFLSLRSAMQAT